MITWRDGEIFCTAWQDDKLVAQVIKSGEHWRPWDYRGTGMAKPMSDPVKTLEEAKRIAEEKLKT